MADGVVRHCLQSKWQLGWYVTVCNPNGSWGGTSLSAIQMPIKIEYLTDVINVQHEFTYDDHNSGCLGDNRGVDVSPS